MHRGYIKLWRKLRDNPLWLAEPFTKGQAWVDLLMLANHEQKSVSVRGIIVTVESGQVLAGEQFLADRWKWSRGKVRRLLRHLEQKTVQQIVQQKNNVCTVIAITNWSDYQDNGTADGTASSTTDGQQKDNRRTTDGHTETLQELQALKTLQEKGINTGANKKPEAKKRPAFVKPTVSQVSGYCRERKNSINPERFIDHYISNGWMVGRTKMKDWKAAVRQWERNQLQNKTDPEIARAKQKADDDRKAEQAMARLRRRGIILPAKTLEAK